MATYVTLANYTAQGMANIKDSPSRLDQAREQLAPLGVEVKDVYLTMGEYDLVIVVEAPDNITAAKALIAMGAQGNITTTTLPAVTEHQFRNLISEMG
ncbi:MAG: GYD domain-containing protein [Acidimicrobiia bacterium]